MGCVGAAVGTAVVGTRVGHAVGATVGAGVKITGATVGVGAPVGAGVGATVGTGLGFGVGAPVGAGQNMKVLLRICRAQWLVGPALGLNTFVRGTTTLPQSERVHLQESVKLAHGGREGGWGGL